MKSLLGKAYKNPEPAGIFSSHKIQIPQPYAALATPQRLSRRRSERRTCTRLFDGPGAGRDHQNPGRNAAQRHGLRVDGVDLSADSLGQHRTADISDLRAAGVSGARRAI